MFLGTKTHGQGHETSFKQILHEKLGIDPREVQFIDGDTDRVAFGMGSNGSRSMVSGGSALVLAADKVIAKGKRIAAYLLEAAEADIVFENAAFTVAGTDRGVTLKQVAMTAFQPAKLPPDVEPGLYENATYAPKRDTFPNGCHVAEVEIDPETGAASLQSYLVVDDVGTIINPLTLAGQIHGGVAQGAGQVLGEQVVDQLVVPAQLLTASFMDYVMPRADMMCNVRIVSNPVPTPAIPPRKRRGRSRMRRRPAGGDDRRHERAAARRRTGTRYAGNPRARPGGPCRLHAPHRRFRCESDRNTGRRCATGRQVLHPRRGIG